MTHPYDELTAEQLRQPHSLKWSTYGEDVLPLWIADMDFPVAPAIRTRLHERIDQSIGYIPMEMAQASLTPHLVQLLAGRGLSVTPAQLKWLPSVVPGLYASVATLTDPGDEVLCVTPTYPPFHHAVNGQGRTFVGVPLRADEGSGWAVDWEALEAAVTPRTRLLMLCHPHNPTGRVWTGDELARFAQLAQRHDLSVCCDELHADLVYPGSPAFRSFAAQPGMWERTLTLVGPCKTYNMAGLSIGAVAGPEPLLARWSERVGGLMGHPGALSLTAWEAALTGAQEWLDDTLAYLQGNRDLVMAWAAQTPGVRVLQPEATYLAWLDLRSHPQAERMAEYLRERGLALNDGPTFDSAAVPERWQGFVRLNFAAPRPVLQEALDRLTAALT